MKPGAHTSRPPPQGVGQTKGRARSLLLKRAGLQEPLIPGPQAIPKLPKHKQAIPTWPVRKQAMPQPPVPKLTIPQPWACVARLPLQSQLLREKSS
eukprot:365555-Chlamydomonas_euryale.AAC.18